jgi:hypothetical protein
MQPDSLPRHAGQKGPKPQGPSALNLPSALRRRRSPPVQVWIAPGLGLGDDFVATLSAISSDSSVVMLTILLVFALAHSGLAFLRPYGEELIGARAYRVVFALVSLPLAIAAVVYFIDHRYDGVPLWNLRWAAPAAAASPFPSFTRSLGLPAELPCKRASCLGGCWAGRVLLRRAEAALARFHAWMRLLTPAATLPSNLGAGA